jgi:hypothetical protein
VSYRNKLSLVDQFSFERYLLFFATSLPIS